MALIASPSTAEPIVAPFAIRPATQASQSVNYAQIRAYFAMFRLQVDDNRQDLASMASESC
jgi:hypothetical protein